MVNCRFFGLLLSGGFSMPRNSPKISSYLFVSIFTICYLFANSFFFIVLSSPRPYFDFYFIYL